MGIPWLRFARLEKSNTTRMSNQKQPLQVPEGFDAIAVMREIRDKLSQEIMHMTFEEERAFLDKIIAGTAR